MSHRKYPILHPRGTRPRRSVSFVVVRFSGDYSHNVLRSECVHLPLNELITIDNRQNLFFDNLSQAINAGLARAQHELIAIVHEDVVLPPGWQQRLESSLAELESLDPEWGLLGSAGWDANNRLIGHWSDPHEYSNTLNKRPFSPVRNLDEQLMILRRSSGLRLDPLLPSIHNIARDLASTLRELRLETYVIDAPTIHKHSDQRGRPIRKKDDSPKIMARNLPSYEADLESSNEYLFAKWPEWRAPDHPETDLELERFSRSTKERLDRPVILLSRGGSGSRLLSRLAQDLGIFLGNEVNISGDSLEMVSALYRAVLDKHLQRASWQREMIVPRIRHAAASMLERSDGEYGYWGFKLPECMLLGSELDRAFPEARYLQLIRDPLTTCLRRTHMTARFDNTIGRVAIREAYRYCGRDPELSLQDSPALRMAYTTIHQVEQMSAFTEAQLSHRYLELRFEDLLYRPAQELAKAATWLGVAPVGRSLEGEVDPHRVKRGQEDHAYSSETQVRARQLLEPLRYRLGYT